MKNSRIAAAVIAASLWAGTAQAEITVGFVTSQSGPGSSIGVLYDRGMKAAVEYANSVGAEKIKFIQLDDYVVARLLSLPLKRTGSRLRAGGKVV